MSTPEHLSIFGLDTWFASSPAERAAAPDTAAHLATCVECKRYLDALESDRAVARPRSKVVRLFPAIAAALALAAGVALFVRSRGVVDDAAYVGVKGVPAAQVLVRSNGRVRLWDGVFPVHAGDALAIRVACEQFAHVTVASASDGGVTRAWEGPCPAGGDALPFTLVVDNQPGREHFDVVLSRERLDDQRLVSAIRSSARTAESWTIAFDFEKEDK